MKPEQRDFFISFNKADRDWADWIAWKLEESGCTVYYQHWDFDTGSNFVLKMDEASQQSKSTILVLSDSFLESKFAKAEWSAAFADDPAGTERKLIPIRVRECDPKGLLGTRVYTDLVGLGEQQAVETLLAAISSERKKPERAIAFPGTAAAPHIYPASHTRAEIIADPTLWLYVSTPSDLTGGDYREIVAAAKATGPTNIVSPEDSESLERADAAVFILNRSPQSEEWQSRLQNDLKMTREKKIRHRLYVADEVASAATAILTAEVESSVYVSYKELARSIQADLQRAREGLQMAGDLDWYLNDDHRRVLIAMRQGNYERAHDLCSALLARRPFSPRGRYNMACILSRQANKATGWERTKLLDDAQQSLQSAVKYGFIDFARHTALGSTETRKTAVEHIGSDPDLQTLFDFRPDIRNLLDEKPARLFGGASSGWAGGGGSSSSDYGCIEATMAVDLYDGGSLPLHQLAAGDRVLSWDETKSTRQPGEVRAVQEHRVSELLIINGDLRVTPRHPLLTRSGWKRASNLVAGDELVGSDGGYVCVRSMVRENGQFRVFDLSVEPHKNLSIRGVVAHNDKF